jgi:hypothetical protein
MLDGLRDALVGENPINVRQWAVSVVGTDGAQRPKNFDRDFVSNSDWAHAAIGSTHNNRKRIRERISTVNC